MHSQGEASVRGIDLSEKMLSRARHMSAADSAIVYECGDLGYAEFLCRLLPESNFNRYDVVISALVLHYFPNLPHLVKEEHPVLKPGRVFVFTIEHPIFTAPSDPGLVEIPALRRDRKEPARV